MKMKKNTVTSPILSTTAMSAIKSKRYPSPRFPRLFNFSRYWKRLVLPHLKDVVVLAALDKGMQAYCKMINDERHEGRPFLRWRRGKIPADYGNTETLEYSESWKELSFYRAYGMCHWLAPFVLALARRIYPKDDWEILTGEHHSTVTNVERTFVFDILNFDRMTARECLLFAGAEPFGLREAKLQKKLFREHPGVNRRKVAH